MKNLSAFSFISLCAITLVTVNCYRLPNELRIWNKHIEVLAEEFRVKVGSRINLRCDARESRYDPNLRWYGPDQHWITGNKNNRIRVQESFSIWFLQLKMIGLQPRDEGWYICRGWFGPENGFRMKAIHLVVERDSPVTKSPFTSTQATTSRATTRRPATVRRTTKKPTTRRPTTVKPTTLPTTPARTTETSTHQSSPYPTPFVHSPITTTTSKQPHSSTLQTKLTLTTASDFDLCLPPWFKCDSGECLDQSYVCDSFPDCYDGVSDERNCGVMVCNEDAVACMSGRQCVDIGNLCDGVPQCRDGSDESTVFCANLTSPAY